MLKVDIRLADFKKKTSKLVKVLENESPKFTKATNKALAKDLRNRIRRKITEKVKHERVHGGKTGYKNYLRDSVKNHPYGEEGQRVYVSAIYASAVEEGSKAYTAPLGKPMRFIGRDGDVVIVQRREGQEGIHYTEEAVAEFESYLGSLLKRNINQYIIRKIMPSLK